MSPLQAAFLGAVEGLTEFVPVSSTGHLILASRFLELEGEAVKTFEVVIQAGALGAVLGLYRTRIASMWRGLLGRDGDGAKLLLHLAVSVLPAAAAGVALHRFIKARLFAVGPVAAALALGGVLMVAVGWRARHAARISGTTLERITGREALLIGCAQCLALWPGMSRAMVTIVAGLWLGWPAAAAAEYSFLLALPTVGAAAIFEVIRGGSLLIGDVSLLSVACGFLSAGLVAALAIRGFLRSLTRWGLAPFGWYRLAFAAAVWFGARSVSLS